MRKCIRCDEIMKEGYMLKTDNFTAAASVLLGKGNGIVFNKTKGKVKAAVCPKCGEISVYLENVDKIE